MGNIKSKIIPEEMKGEIDNILEEQLFNANRYFAESNPNISELMNYELFREPVLFLKRLKERWVWHNSYYENLLEPAYSSIIRDNEIELSPKEIDELISIYNTCCNVDEATLVMSGAIKKYLDYNCKYVTTVDENLDTNESNNMLITPPVETFFTQYQIDHLFYIYLLKTNNNKSIAFKKELLKKYHANDEEIFKSRFSKKFKGYLDSNKSEREILEDIQGYTISENYKIKHFYFTLEHPDRKAIRDIIIYDNLDEKLISSNLIGISGFLFRKKILEYLNDSNILNNSGYIYEFNKDIIMSCLEILKEERVSNMDKNIRPYRQRGDTCAIACMMMVLEYYKVMQKANWYDERRYYKIYRSSYMCGTPFSALAYHFSKNGLDTTIYHEDKDLFNNNQKAIPDEIFENAMDEYKTLLERAIKSGTNVINGKTIDINLIRNELEKGNIVILAGERFGVYHAILVSGYDKDKFIICDPLYRHKQMKTANELTDFMNTSIGKWFISVNNNTLEKKNLLNNLDKYNDESYEMMNVNNRSLSYEKK